jgi:sugar phosphate isomerase/epimerase
MVKIACVTIVFGPSIKDRMDEVLEEVTKIGYDGVETGARYFDLEKPDFYRDLFRKWKIELLALHVGGNFLDKDSVKEQIKNIRATVGFGKKLGVRYLHLSGVYKEGKTAEDYRTEAESYREIGGFCLDEGLTLCYHNHYWEFMNKGEGMKILLEEVSPNLMKLVPDVGWVEVSGVSAVDFLKKNIARVEAVHFKDFKKLLDNFNGPKEFTELGRGIVPFTDIYHYMTSLNRDWWICAEQDKTSLEPLEAARINYHYVAGLGKKEEV